MQRIRFAAVSIPAIWAAATALVMASFVVFSPMAQACSNGVFAANGKLIVARNMDWPSHSGMVVINPRGARWQSLAVRPEDGANWYAKYGYITFNLTETTVKLGKLSGPGGGINEKGLYVASLWGPEPEYDKYSANDKRKGISVIEVVPYALSQYADVEQALTGISRVRVHPLSMGKEEVTLHWLLVDASGDTAYVQFNRGKFEIYRKPSLKAMTNESYGEERKYISAYRDFGGTLAVPDHINNAHTNSFERFLLLAKFVQDTDRGKRPVSVEAVFEALYSVRQAPAKEVVQSTWNSATAWTELYDYSTKTVYWRSGVTGGIKYVKLDDINFAMTGTKQVLDIHSEVEGNLLGKFTLIL